MSLPHTTHADIPADAWTDEHPAPTPEEIALGEALGKIVVVEQVDGKALVEPRD